MGLLSGLEQLLGGVKTAAESAAVGLRGGSYGFTTPTTRLTPQQALAYKPYHPESPEVQRAWLAADQAGRASMLQELSHQFMVRPQVAAPALQVRQAVPMGNYVQGPLLQDQAPSPLQGNNFSQGSYARLQSPGRLPQGSFATQLFGNFNTRSAGDN